MAETRIRVMVVDDQTIVRKGVRALISEIEGIEVVAEAEDGEEAVARAEELSPDVILMDLVLPRMDGIEAIRQITARNPQARILALTSFGTDDKVFPAIEAGALGYLLKDSDPEDLIGAIRRVHDGEPSLAPDIARKVLGALSRPIREPRTPEPLSDREAQVLRLVATGMTNREIAEELHVSETTVRTHVSAILRKLHLANRVQATLYALRERLTTLDPPGSAS